ncbi:hypothetical protein PR202_ga28491 [Eleusine coracana subsp. coracana]|uniref:NAC domain-containing protein n=1 Tax=Eleusine coracana subsp. coracana TaxID=191504 RepID=A0AAV5DJR4_ELECO|nr:hypothetical protein QOZ80_7AG0554190 [Eleusine coracana subsp. coracana]GJN10401.1 hypothetical protein PR202_ga28491 [Eleusine coracana subsp. coracana]
MSPPPTDTTNKPETPRATTPAPCFDTHPSDLALVEQHLRPWIASSGRVKPAAFVTDADLYAAPPGDLARAFAPAVARDGEKAWYFLTRLRLKSPCGRGRRFARTVGSAAGAGCWHGEARERPVVDALGGGGVVGRRQFFSFMRDDGRGGRVRTGWIMAELRAGAVDEFRGVDELPVLCKVYRSPRHPAEPDDDDVIKAVKALAAVEQARGKGQVDDGGESSATTTAVGEISGRDRDEKTANDDEGSVETSVAAPPARERDAVADEDRSSVAPRKRKAVDGGDDDETSAAAPRKRKAVDGGGDGESSAGASRNRAATDGNTTCCPRCGFHLDAAQLAPKVVGSETEIAQQGGETMGPPKFYKFI